MTRPQTRSSHELRALQRNSHVMHAVARNVSAKDAMHQMSAADLGVSGPIRGAHADCPRALCHLLMERVRSASCATYLTASRSGRSATTSAACLATTYACLGSTSTQMARL